MPQHSSGAPGAGVERREDSVQPVYKVRAEMQDWVSMYMVKEEDEIGIVGRRKWW